MQLKREMVDGLRELVSKGAKQVDLAKAVGVTAQHMGRIIKGQPHSVSDSVGVKICELLGLPVEYSMEAPRKYFFEATYSGEDMKPILRDGQTLFCEPVPINAIRPGDIVLCQFEDRSNGRPVTRETIRYWEPIENRILLKPERFDGTQYETTVTKIHWVARVLRPMRRMRIKERKL